MDKQYENKFPRLNSLSPSRISSFSFSQNRVDNRHTLYFFNTATACNVVVLNDAGLIWHVRSSRFYFSAFLHICRTIHYFNRCQGTYPILSAIANKLEGEPHIPKGKRKIYAPAESVNGRT